MIKTHFEIAKITQIDEHNQEIQSVFSANNLSECLKEWKEKQYDKINYFIDVWEQKENDVPYPIADINIPEWIFN